MPIAVRLPGVGGRDGNGGKGDLRAPGVNYAGDMSWRGRISGQFADLERLRAAAGATAGVDVIEDAEDGFQIHAAELDGLPDAAMAHARYKTLVRQINGLLLAQFGFHYSGTSLDYVIEIDPGGARRRTAIQRSNVVGPVLPAEAPPPEPLAMAALTDVRADVELADAIERYAEAKDWPDLYDVFEIVWKSMAAVQRLEARSTRGSAGRRSVGASRRRQTCTATRARRRGPRSPCPSSRETTSFARCSDGPLRVRRRVRNGYGTAPSRPE